MRAKRATVILGGVSVLVLSATALAPAMAKNLPATPPKASPPPKNLTVTGGTVVGLAPGTGVKSLGVKVSNPKQNTGSVTVQRVTVMVDRAKSQISDSCAVRIDPTAEQRAAADIVVTSYDAARATGSPITLERNDVPRDVPVTIEMLNRAEHNQNPCRGAKLAFNYTATAAGR